jgi:hypothetical protein
MGKLIQLPVPPGETLQCISNMGFEIGSFRISIRRRKTREAPFSIESVSL